jgi:hypothetical protein
VTPHRWRRALVVRLRSWLRRRRDFKARLGLGPDGDRPCPYCGRRLVAEPMADSPALCVVAHEQPICEAFRTLAEPDRPS